MSYHQNINLHLRKIKTRRLGKRRIAAVTFAFAAIIGGLSLNTNSADRGKTQAAPATGMHRISLALPPEQQTIPPDIQAEPLEQAEWQTESVKKGDSLSRIFNRLGLSARTLHDIMNSDKQTEAYKRLRAGQTIEFRFNENQVLAGLRFSPERTTTIKTTLTDNGWKTQVIDQQVETRMAHASGVIQDSLFISGSRAGLSDNTIMQLAGIFGWDIDFALDIRKGDQFSVVYETRYLDGEKIGDGKIIAAEFINRGKTFQAVQYTNADKVTDYFAPDGNSMRKAFLRTPVKFSRISSRFTRKRWHPVLNKWRSHKGVDYAAPRGTPVKATSDGKVAFRGRKGGYGKVIFIDNGKAYRTVYGHLNSFAKGIRKGKQVKQGQIIGYVGSTGLATGPHLHYELRINGVHRNPLTAKLPKAKPIAKKYLQDVRNWTTPWLARLNLIKAVQLADTSATSSSKTLTN